MKTIFTTPFLPVGIKSEKNGFFGFIIFYFLLSVIFLPLVASGQAGITNHDWVWAKSTEEQFASNYVVDSTTDTDGNTYITGWFRSNTIKFGSIVLTRSSNVSNIFVAKFDPNGNVLWAKTNAGVGTSESWAIAIDANNNVYITGTFNEPSISFENTTLFHSGSGSDIFIVKFNSQGNLLWAKDVDYTNTIWVRSIATDSQGNILVSGSFSSSPITFGSTTLSSSGSNTNSFIAKFDANGSVIWAKTAQSNSANWCTGVATDLSGNIIITGNYSSNSTSPFIIDGITLPNSNNVSSVFLIKFNTSGNVLWTKASNGNSSHNWADYPNNVKTDVSGNIVVTGSFKSSIINFGAISLTNSNSNNTPDIFVVKYDPSGNEMWAKKAGGSGYETGHKLTSDNNKNIFVTGFFESKPANFGSFIIDKENGYSPIIFVAKYDENGSEKWVKYVEKTNVSSPAVPSTGIGADIAGNLYVTGSCYDGVEFGNISLTKGGIFVAKLGESQLGTNDLNSSNDILKIYPNPTTGIFNLINDLPQNATIKIYNISGQIVYESMKIASAIDFSDKPKGIYFIHCCLGSEILRREKLIVQ